MSSVNVKIVVFVPETHAEVVRQAMGEAGAGRLGNYSHCSFSSKGWGRFTPRSGANPHSGAVGKHEVVAEERIEMVCQRHILSQVIAALKASHPYEEVPIDVYALEEVAE